MRGPLLLALGLSAEQIPLGRIIDDVKCAEDSSQGYALYLPSTDSPERAWSLILAFDPRIYTAELSGGARVAIDQASLQFTF
jgi:hypothetical protein